MNQSQFNELQRQANVIEQNAKRIKDQRIRVVVFNDELDIFKKIASNYIHINYIIEPFENDDKFSIIYFDDPEHFYSPTLFSIMMQVAQKKAVNIANQILNQ